MQILDFKTQNFLKTLFKAPIWFFQVNFINFPSRKFFLRKKFWKEKLIKVGGAYFLLIIAQFN